MNRRLDRESALMEAASWPSALRRWTSTRSPRLAIATQLEPQPVGPQYSSEEGRDAAWGLGSGGSGQAAAAREAGAGGVQWCGSSWSSYAAGWSSSRIRMSDR